MNWHPMLVHFPIVFWCTALLFGALWAWRGDERLWVFGRWLLYLGAVSAVVAAVSGYTAADAMGHHSPGHDLVHTHRNWMVAATILGVLAAIAAWRVGDPAERTLGRKLVGALMIATVVVSALGADRGALLVYRYSIGTLKEKPPASDHHHHGHHDH